MLTVGELKKIMEEYTDDVEICVDLQGNDCYDVETTYDDECRPGRRGLFIQAGEELPPL